MSEKLVLEHQSKMSTDTWDGRRLSIAVSHFRPSDFCRALEIILATLWCRAQLSKLLFQKLSEPKATPVILESSSDGGRGFGEITGSLLFWKYGLIRQIWKNCGAHSKNSNNRQQQQTATTGDRGCVQAKPSEKQMEATPWIREEKLYTSIFKTHEVLLCVFTKT